MDILWSHRAWEPGNAAAEHAPGFHSDIILPRSLEWTKFVQSVYGEATKRHGPMFRVFLRLE